MNLQMWDMRKISKLTHHYALVVMCLLLAVAHDQGRQRLKYLNVIAEAKLRKNRSEDVQKVESVAPYLAASHKSGKK
jgi:hypothetical protein